MKRMCVVIMAMGCILFFGQINEDEIRRLIDKIDSVEINERDAALSELKSKVRNDKKVLEFLKSESEKESNSYNIRFFLKRLVKEIENEGEEGKVEQNIEESTKPNVDDKWLRELFQRIGEGRVEVTLCKKNKCKKYKADSCEELLKKYPDLKGRVNCEGNMLFLFKNLEDELEMFKDIFNNKSRKLKEFSKEFIKKKFLTPFFPQKDKADDNPEDSTKKYFIMNKAIKYVDYGFEIEELTDEELKSLNIGSGVRVKNLKSGSFGEAELKLKENDIIISIDGEKIYNKWIFRRKMQDYFKGSGEFSMEILREGKVQVIKF